jgi:hypothetical protein
VTAVARQTEHFTRDPSLWHCPDCGAPTWPRFVVISATDEELHGQPVARRCVPCQIKTDES